jgi:Sulfotransferase domain
MSGGGTVVLDVIGAGFGRTGTNSLQLALEQLGFGPCYHMLEVIRGADAQDRWEPALADGPTDWADVFRDYRSTVDWPGCAFWRELVTAFPAAKVVLTVRDPHSWYASAKRTIFADGDQLDDPELPAPEDLSPETLEFLQFMMGGLLPRVLSDGRGGRLDELDEEPAIAAFERHNQAVRDAVPADRLLEYRVGQGWQPLCDFLEVPVPAGDFPHANDSGSFRKTFAEALRQRPNLTRA